MLCLVFADSARPYETQSRSLAERGDRYFFIGCLVCGTWVLGALGAAILGYGMYLLRKAQIQGERIRPWPITIVGGLILIDSSINYLAWGLDFFWSHCSVLVRNLWINYGMVCDGAYSLYYNTTAIGGVSIPVEKSIQVSSILLVFPVRIAAAWGLLKMKRWGLQCSIIGNWMYLTEWIAYAAAMTLWFDTRFAPAEGGVLGFWLIIGLPFIGPVVLLPFLHTVNRKLWTE